MTTQADSSNGQDGARQAPWPGGPNSIELPMTLFRYVLATSRVHQAALVVMTTAVFLLELVPLELQRRIVNDLVKGREYRAIVILCAVYCGAVLVQGGTKLVLNIYRSWVGERAVRDLRTRVDTMGEIADDPEIQGIEAAMMVAEVEPVGGFVASSISEPLLQGGILLSTMAYMIHLDPWMALAAAAIFVPQLVIVPFLQSAIVRRTDMRIRILRLLSIGIVLPNGRQKQRATGGHAHIDQVFEIGMKIFRLKFTVNFLMNFCNHLQVVAALLFGGWYVLHNELVIGGVVAFISAVGRLNDPWGDLINYFRDLSTTNVKYRLIAKALHAPTR